MMTQNLIYVDNSFSVRDSIDLKHSGNIFTSNLMTVRRWNQMLVQRIQQHADKDGTVHIRPWQDNDWQQYAQLQAYITHTYVWLLGDAPAQSDSITANVSFIKSEQLPASERFVIIKTQSLSRALVSWRSQTGEYNGVLITHPMLIDAMLVKANALLS